MSPPSHTPGRPTIPEPAGTQRTSAYTQTPGPSVGSGGDQTRAEASATAPPAPAFGPPAEPGEVDLWEHFTLLVLLCALLGIHWAVRLRRGYV